MRSLLHALAGGLALLLGLRLLVAWLNPVLPTAAVLLFLVLVAWLVLGRPGRL